MNRKRQDAAKAAKRKRRADNSKQRRGPTAPRWSAELLAAVGNSYWEQRPDPDAPQSYNLFMIRLPSGGRKQPEAIYLGRDVAPRLQRFCSNVLAGMKDGRAALQSRLAASDKPEDRTQLAATHLAELLAAAPNDHEYARQLLVAAAMAWGFERDESTIGAFLELLRHQIDASPVLQESPPQRH